MSDNQVIHNVSRETIQKLKEYEALVKEWNMKFNLIAKSSVNDIWNRHIVDSLQLCQFLRSTDKLLYDFGSGAGFPGIVLAIAAEELYPNLSIKLVESIKKKANFLNVVKNTLNLNVDIINDRIENIKCNNVDVISSRALASLTKLFEYSLPFCSLKTRLIFPKGNKWNEEVIEAQKQWLFDFDVAKSITDETGHILNICNLRRKKW